MLIRALIVLLLALNLGVAGWWLLRAPSRPAPPTLPADVARLHLVGESGTLAPPATPAATARDDAASAAPMQCLSLGPFETADEVARARVGLQALALRQLSERRVYSGPTRGWRVWLPPFADRAAVEDAAARVAAAGFEDYFVVRGGEEANSLALGRYANEATARARAATLAEAGFAARAEPIRSGPVSIWLDIAAAADFDAARAQALVAAPQREPLDCAELQ